MRHTEISILNHVMLMRPEHVQSAAMCPREEVAAPSKILRRHEWLDVRAMQAFDSELLEAYAEIVSSDRCSCYLLAPEESLVLWKTVFDVPISSAHIKNWLDSHWDKRFIVTYPIINKSYSYSHKPPYIFRLPDPTCMHIQTQLHNKSYTICNGLTIALAMHRSGAWPGRVMKQIDLNSLPRLEAVDIDTKWMPFYNDHILQICDFPTHYALCGGADLGVIAHLMRASGPAVQLQQQMLGSRIKYASYTATAFSSGKVNWELYKMLTSTASWPARSYLHTNGDTSEPDWFGFARACVGSRGFWRAWRQNARFRTDVLIKLNSSPSQKSVLNLVFPALFVLHEQGFHRARVRELWKTCFAFFGRDTVVPWLRAYITRHLVTELMSEQFPRDVMRHTMPPVAFMKEGLRPLTSLQKGVSSPLEGVRPLTSPQTGVSSPIEGLRMFANEIHEIHEYRFYVRAMTDARAKHLLKCDLPITCVENENAYRIKISLHGTLKRLAHANARTYLKYYVERPALLRLCCLKRIFWGPSAPADGHVIGDIMTEHFKTRRQELFG